MNKRAMAPVNGVHGPKEVFAVSCQVRMSAARALVPAHFELADRCTMRLIWQRDPALRLNVAWHVLIEATAADKAISVAIDDLALELDRHQLNATLSEAPGLVVGLLHIDGGPAAMATLTTGDAVEPPARQMDWLRRPIAERHGGWLPQTLAHAPVMGRVMAYGEAEVSMQAILKRRLPPIERVNEAVHFFKG